jgi:hypothetical protein
MTSDTYPATNPEHADDGRVNVVAEELPDDQLENVAGGFTGPVNEGGQYTSPNV